MNRLRQFVVVCPSDRESLMSKRRLGLVSTASMLALFSLQACNCGLDNVVEVAPQIFVDACKKPLGEANGVPIGGFEDCAMSFGSTDLSVRVTKQIKVTNPSQIPLKIDSVTLEGDPNFKLEVAPKTIEGNLSAIISVSARPLTETAITGKIIITSNAKNTKQNAAGKSVIEIPIDATGVNNGVPQIVIDPPECDFGNVAVNGVAACSLNVKNTGTRSLFLDAVDFQPAVTGGPLFQAPAGNQLVPFGLTGRAPLPTDEIAVNAAVSITVRFSPDVLGAYAGRLRIQSNDPSNTTVAVPLQGHGVTPPTCSIRIDSINGVPVDPSVTKPPIKPLDDVRVTADQSTPSVNTGSITGYHWSFGQKPAQSTVDFDAPSAQSTGFVFDVHHAIDVAGTFVVHASVTDDLGVQSVNDCSLTFDSIPSDSFLVQLTWDTGSTDFDLHLTKQDDTNRYCIEGPGQGQVSGLSQECDNGLDCYFGNCNPGESPRPEWDGVNGLTDGDPSLDIDDTNGFGPENINVNHAVPGRYLVGASYYGGGPDTAVTLRLFLFGQVAGEWNVNMSESGSTSYQEFAVVVWPSDPTVLPCLEDLQDGDPHDQCG